MLAKCAARAASLIYRFGALTAPGAAVATQARLLLQPYLRRYSRQHENEDVICLREWLQNAMARPASDHTPQTAPDAAAITALYSRSNMSERAALFKALTTQPLGVDASSIDGTMLDWQRAAAGAAPDAARQHGDGQDSWTRARAAAADWLRSAVGPKYVGLILEPLVQLDGGE